jgi:hypothetical protein
MPTPVLLGHPVRVTIYVQPLEWQGCRLHLTPGVVGVVVAVYGPDASRIDATCALHGCQHHFNVHYGETGTFDMWCVMCPHEIEPVH